MTRWMRRLAVPGAAAAVVLMVATGVTALAPRDPVEDTAGDFEQPYRAAAGQLTGDLWVLELAESATDNWSQLTVVAHATADGQPSRAVLDDRAGSYVEYGPVTLLHGTDLSVSVDEAAGTARIVDRSASPRDLAELSRVADERVAEGSYGSRGPEEQPTRVDMFDLAVAPSFWSRTMVRRMADTITVTGQETVAGRTAHVVEIHFGEPASAKYGDEGFTWWVDAETGILLRYTIGSADPAIPPATFEMTSVELSAELPDSVTIPAGVAVDLSTVAAGGASEAHLGIAPAPVDARLVAETGSLG